MECRVPPIFHYFVIISEPILICNSEVKPIFYSDFLSVGPMFLFYPWILSRIPHCISQCISFWFSWLWQFPRHASFWWPWQFWQVLVEYGVGCSSAGICVMGFWTSERKIRNGMLLLSVMPAPAVITAYLCWYSSPLPSRGGVSGASAMLLWPSFMLYYWGEVSAHTCRGRRYSSLPEDRVSTQWFLCSEDLTPPALIYLFSIYFYQLGFLRIYSVRCRDISNTTYFVSAVAMGNLG